MAEEFKSVMEKCSMTVLNKRQPDQQKCNQIGWDSNSWMVTHQLIEYIVRSYPTLYKLLRVYRH